MSIWVVPQACASTFLFSATCPYSYLFFEGAAGPAGHSMGLVSVAVLAVSGSNLASFNASASEGVHLLFRQGARMAEAYACLTRAARLPPPPHTSLAYPSPTPCWTLRAPPPRQCWQCLTPPGSTWLQCWRLSMPPLPRQSRALLPCCRNGHSQWQQQQ